MFDLPVEVKSISTRILVGGQTPDGTPLLGAMHDIVLVPLALALRTLLKRLPPQVRADITHQAAAWPAPESSFRTQPHSAQVPRR